MRLARWIAVAALALDGPAAAQPDTQTPRVTVFDSVSEADRVDSVTQSDELAFKLDAHQRMTVPVRLSGSGPFRFLVDTGSERTAISRQLAERLRLPPGRPARLHSVAGASIVNTAAVRSLEVSDQAMSVLDAPLLDAAHIGADGILGVDSLRSQRVIFDFKALTMNIVPAATRVVPSEEGTIVVSARRRSGRLVLAHATANRRTVDVVVDTGAQFSVGNAALRRALLGGRALKHEGTTELLTVAGETLRGSQMVLNELKLGEVTMKGLVIVFTDTDVFRQLGLEERPALLLGMNGMRGFAKVSIDFERKRLRLLLRERSSIDGVAFAQR